MQVAFPTAKFLPPCTLHRTFFEISAHVIRGIADWFCEDLLTRKSLLQDGGNLPERLVIMEVTNFRPENSSR